VSKVCVKLVAAFALTFGHAIPCRAAADAPQVLLVRPPAAAHEVSAALVRVQGELVADGFEVVSLEAAPGATSEMAMDQAESQSTSTTVGLFLSADGKSAELWVVDRLTNKTVVRRVATGGESQNLLPEVLALKAVELLRASLLELVVERNAAAANPPVSRVAAQHASDWAARPLVSVPKWGIETGAAAIWSPGQIDVAFESLVRARFALLESLQIRLSFAGLGTRPQVGGTGGTAQIAEWWGLADGVFLPFPKLIVRPIASLALGTFHTTVKGEASFPYRGVDASQWALAADAGVGVCVRLASRLELVAEGYALLTTPEPIVRFVSDEGPHVARPAVASSLSLLGWL
jgi:hypothetical protein